MIILICYVSMTMSSEIWGLTFHSTSSLLVLPGALGVTKRWVRQILNLEGLSSLTAGTDYYRIKRKLLLLVRK